MAAAITKLGDDLLVEILIRSFPNPKPAYRCKIVCKRWNSLISDPVFNHRFVSYHKSINDNIIQPPPLLITPSSSLFRHRCLSFLPVPVEVGPDLKVCDSFKDLLLCGFTGEFCNSEGLMRSYFVCNPFTKHWIALPLAPERPRWNLGFVTRLACEPVSSISLDIGGDDQAADASSYSYSEYRFRVLCMYQIGHVFRLDVFCSESREWTKEALVSSRDIMMTTIQPCNNGRLFWVGAKSYEGLDRPHGFKSLILRMMNPFRLDVPCTIVFDSIVFPEWTAYWVSVSQGALYVVLLELKPWGCSRNALSVLRLEDDCKSWRKLHEVLMKETVWSLSNYSYELKRCFKVRLHPERPEIAFLYYDDSNQYRDKKIILSYDLTGKGEVEFVDEWCGDWMAFQPKVSCWPTMIPRYEELRGAYDASYKF